MKTLLSFFSVISMLAPLPVLAADTPPAPPLAAILAAVDAAFAQAQSTVNDAPLDDSTKSSVSNVLKTKHDTVKNSISNIR